MTHIKFSQIKSWKIYHTSQATSQARSKRRKEYSKPDSLPLNPLYILKRCKHLTVIMDGCIRTDWRLSADRESLHNVAPLRGKVGDQDRRVPQSRTRSIIVLSDEDRKSVHALDLLHRMPESVLRSNTAWKRWKTSKPVLVAFCRVPLLFPSMGERIFFLMAPVLS